MTKEEKQLLIKDLCARLLYWPNVKTVDDDDAYIVGLDDTEDGLFYVHILEDGDSYDTTMSVENFKPYLRPLSSITEKEKEEASEAIEIELNALQGPSGFTVENAASSAFQIDFYNKHHLDYRGLIPMGLALEAPKDMYKTE